MGATRAPLFVRLQLYPVRISTGSKRTAYSIMSNVWTTLPEDVVHLIMHHYKSPRAHRPPKEWRARAPSVSPPTPSQELHDLRNASWIRDEQHHLDEKKRNGRSARSAAGRQAQRMWQHRHRFWDTGDTPLEPMGDADTDGRSRGNAQAQRAHGKRAAQDGHNTRRWWQHRHHHKRSSSGGDGAERNAT